jgi:hypothetical protein
MVKQSLLPFWSAAERFGQRAIRHLPDIAQPNWMANVVEQRRKKQLREFGTP